MNWEILGVKSLFCAFLRIAEIAEGRGGEINFSDTRRKCDFGRHVKLHKFCKRNLKKLILVILKIVKITFLDIERRFRGKMFEFQNSQN